jgi:hypothetical protein
VGINRQHCIDTKGRLAYTSSKKKGISYQTNEKNFCFVVVQRCILQLFVCF